MKILFTFAISDFTGASRVGLRYARALRESGHEVLVVSETPPREGDSIVYHLQEEGFEVHHLGQFLKAANPVLVIRLAAFMRRRGIEVAVSMNQGDVKTTGWAAALAKVAYVPLVQNLRNFGTGRSGRIKEALYGLTMRACSTLAIAVSPATQAETVRRFGLPAEKVECVHNAIDPTQLPAQNWAERERLRTELGLAPTDFAFICVGRLSEQKGQKVLLEAWRSLAQRYPQAHLLIVGDAGENPEEKAYAAALHEIVQQAGLKRSVHFLGWRNDVPQLLLASDAYAHASLWEGFPLVILESFGAYLPTIMTDCVGRPAGFVDDVQGYLVKAGDVDSLAAAMAQLLEKKPAELNAMGGAARELLEAEFDIRRNVLKFVACVQAAARG